MHYASRYTVLCICIYSYCPVWLTRVQSTQHVLCNVSRGHFFFTIVKLQKNWQKSIFQTVNTFYISNLDYKIHSLIFQRCTSLGCINIGIRKSEFMAKNIVKFLKVKNHKTPGWGRVCCTIRFQVLNCSLIWFSVLWIFVYNVLTVVEKENFS